MKSESGSSEIVVVFVAFIMFLSILGVGVVINIVSYDMFIEKVFSEISDRVRKQATIYKYTNSEIESNYDNIKSEYLNDFVCFYRGNVISKKTRELIINNIELKQMKRVESNELEETNNSDDDIEGYYIYSMNLNLTGELKLPLVFFQYRPKKYTYICIPKFEQDKETNIVQ